MAIGNKATSGDKSKFGASVKQLVIGSVPDRGGRTDKAAAAVAEQTHGHRKYPPKSGGEDGHGKPGKGASSKKSRKH